MSHVLWREEGKRIKKKFNFYSKRLCQKNYSMHFLFILFILKICQKKLPVEEQIFFEEILLNFKSIKIATQWKIMLCFKTKMKWKNKMKHYFLSVECFSQLKHYFFNIRTRAKIWFQFRFKVNTKIENRIIILNVFICYIYFSQ